MFENIENTENIKLKEILEELQYLREENTQLKQNNTVLGHELTYFKEYSADLEDKINNEIVLIEGKEFIKAELKEHIIDSVLYRKRMKEFMAKTEE